MIRIDATNNKKILNDLSQKIFRIDYDKDTGFLLYYNDLPIGLASLKIDMSISKLIKIGVLKEYRKKGFGDFFTRSLILRLSEISPVISVEYYDDYYKQFGFETEDNKTMNILSEKIVFPSKCQNK